MGQRPRNHVSQNAIHGVFAGLGFVYDERGDRFIGVGIWYYKMKVFSDQTTHPFGYATRASQKILRGTIVTDIETVEPHSGGISAKTVVTVAAVLCSTFLGISKRLESCSDSC